MSKNKMAILISTLEFYADKTNYNGRDPKPQDKTVGIVFDIIDSSDVSCAAEFGKHKVNAGGHRARVALKKWRENNENSKNKESS